MIDVNGFVLAGGKSSRMGQDKAFIDLAGRTLLVRALALAQTVTDDVRIVGDREKFSGFGVVVEDILEDRGPLGGIHAALKASHAELNLMLAVDVPLVPPEFLEYLIAEAKASKAVVTMPRAGGHLQTLCAVYGPSFVVGAEAALQQGKNKIDPLLAALPVRILEEDELVRQGFRPEMFHNVNTPEDLEHVEKALVHARKVF
jgi:molybdenum cofactor guanylyltransferase